MPLSAVRMRKSALLAVLAGALTLVFLDPPDRMYADGWCGSAETRDPRCLFATDYEEARRNFIDRVRQLKEKNVNVEVVSKQIAHGLFIDFAVVRPDAANATEKFVVHSAGVHGIEGFAGAAVQLEIMDKLGSGEMFVPDDTSLVFIFPVNPFGMKHKRRFNENNVDLNRNALDDHNVTDFKIPGYIQDIQEGLISPHDPVSLVEGMKFWIGALWRLATRGLTACKAAVVSGQYHHVEGLFYGGKELQVSVKVVESVLESLGVFNVPSVWVDVHTGLGPFGEDSLLVVNNEDGKKVEVVFPEKNVEYPEKPGVAQYGYDYMRGSLAQYFKNKTKAPMICITQEFGTYNVIFNFRALMLENGAYHLVKDAQPYFATKYLETAFNPQSHVWRKAVVKNGGELFARVLQERHLL